MNRTLLLLNALALAILVALVALPQDLEASSPTLAAPAMHTQRAVFDAGNAPASIQSLRLQPTHQQDRLSF